MNLLILVVDDEPDVEVLFRQQFRRDLRAGQFTMEFAQSAPMALQRITDAGDRSLILILSDINMPGMSGLELLPQARAARPFMPDRRSSAILVAGASSTTQPMATPSTLRRDWKLPTSNSAPAYAPAQRSRRGWKSSEADRSGTLF